MKRVERFKEQTELQKKVKVDCVKTHGHEFMAVPSDRHRVIKEMMPIIGVFITDSVKRQNINLVNVKYYNKS